MCGPWTVRLGLDKPGVKMMWNLKKIEPYKFQKLNRDAIVPISIPGQCIRKCISPWAELFTVKHVPHLKAGGRVAWEWVRPPGRVALSTFKACWRDALFLLKLPAIRKRDGNRRFSNPAPGVPKHSSLPSMYWPGSALLNFTHLKSVDATRYSSQGYMKQEKVNFVNL